MADDDATEVEITVPPELQTGVYANFAAISTQTPHDFTLDFIQLIPGSDAPQAIVVARIKLAPSFLMPLMQTLAKHQTDFEDALRKLREQEEGETP
jgi:hypothetical protein